MLYRDALGHEYDEPRRSDLREINEIMDETVKGWKRYNGLYNYGGKIGRQKGWIRVTSVTNPDTETCNQLPIDELDSVF